jgi:DNA-binding transcriptional ArsR family regulator
MRSSMPSPPFYEWCGPPNVCPSPTDGSSAILEESPANRKLRDQSEIFMTHQSQTSDGHIFFQRKTQPTKMRCALLANEESGSLTNQFAAEGMLNCSEIFFLTISSHLYKVLLMDAISNLDAAFSALADPTRRAILVRLATGEATVMELAAPFEMTQPAISQHLKVLEDAGLVVRRVDGTKRPRRLAKAGVEAMDQWLAMLRKALEKSYDRLDEVLASMEKQKRGKTR